MYLARNKTQFTPSCIANMILDEQYDMLKWFVNENNVIVQSNIWLIAVTVNDQYFLNKMRKEKWNVLKEGL